MSNRINNFDIIRFFMAWAVIYAHSFVLVGSNDVDVCNKLTTGSIDCGAFAVSTFFIISGYLICISFVKKACNSSYLYSRIMRIFPALIVVILVTIFCVGPIMTNLSLGEYFTNPFTYLYGLNIFLFHFDTLPGVFTNNVFPNAINGSLWTLICEFALYMYIFFMGNIKLLKKEIILGLSIIILLFYSFVELPFLFAKIAELFLFFNAGMLFFLYEEKIKYNYQLFFLSLLLLSVFSFTGFFMTALIILLLYVTLFLSIGPVKKVANFTRFGDFSYGIYIYAFLIQQILMNMFNNKMSTFMNVFLTTIIALVCAFISWNLIEKMFIQKAKGFAKKKFAEKKNNDN